MTTGLMHQESSRRPARWSLAAMMVLAASALPVGALAGTDDAALPPANAPDERGVTWRFTWDNDVVVRSDNEFTNGLSVQVHGPPVRTWGEVAGTPAFGKAMAKLFLPDRREDLYFREGWSVGHAIQTPYDLKRKDLIVDDVPYAAVLAVQNTWIAYDDKQLYGFGWLMGLVGPAAMGRQIQNGFHRLSGSDHAEGWSHQLKNEPLLNFYYEYKRKLVGSSIGDIAVGAEGKLGNLITAAAVTVETRLGWHVPRGFQYNPDPIGRKLSFDAQLPPPEPTNWTFYASMTAGAGALGYTELLDGNLFHDSHSVDHKTFGDAVAVGLHYLRRSWGIHLTVAHSSAVADQPAQGDRKDSYGSMMIEFRR